MSVDEAADTVIYGAPDEFDQEWDVPFMNDPSFRLNAAVAETNSLKKQAAKLQARLDAAELRLAQLTSGDSSGNDGSWVVVEVDPAGDGDSRVETARSPSPRYDADDRKAFEAAGRILGSDCLHEIPPFADQAHVEEWEVLLHIAEEAGGGGRGGGSPPTAEQRELLKERKTRLKALAAAVDAEGKAFIKKQEAVMKKVQQAANKKKAKVQNDTMSAEDKAAQKEAARAKQAATVAAKQAKQAKMSAKQRAKANEHLFSTVGEWFKIKIQLDKRSSDGEFEVELPEWLYTREDYLDKCDLDEGLILLETDEVELMLVAASAELARSYFGNENDWDGAFALDNLAERAATASAISSKDGLPCWYECKTEPPLMEEMTLSFNEAD